MYDVIIIWAWASWLFCACNLQDWMKALILESNKISWSKVLLSWWWRCNFTNEIIDIENNFVWENVKFLYSLFHKFSNKDMLNWLKDNWLWYKLEDNWKYFLLSEKSKDLLEVFFSIIEKKWINITNNCLVEDVICIDWWFEIATNLWIYYTKKVVISTWWKSFPQLWTLWFWYDLAKKYWGKINNIYKGLCGIVTKENNENFAGSPLDVKLQVYVGDKIFLEKSWTVLFSHFGLTWPFIFDIVLKLWSYLSKKWIVDIEEYICQNVTLKLYFDQVSLSRKLVKLIWNNDKLEYSIQWIRSWKEAKVTWWWLSLKEIGNDFQFRKCPWMYFIWEVLDITWVTWWYNLQFAWSSGYWCGKNINSTKYQVPSSS